MIPVSDVSGSGIVDPEYLPSWLLCKQSAAVQLLMVTKSHSSSVSKDINCSVTEVAPGGAMTADMTSELSYASLCTAPARLVQFCCSLLMLNVSLKAVKTGRKRTMSTCSHKSLDSLLSIYSLKRLLSLLPLKSYTFNPKVSYSHKVHADF
jgi:hypothetical protein